MNREQLVEFKRRYGTGTDEGLARRFGIPVEEVRALAAEHALGKDKKRFPVGTMPRWRPEEISELSALYADMDNHAIARKLGRTVKSVVSKAHNLGLKKSVERLEQMGQANVRLRRDRQGFSEQC